MISDLWRATQLLVKRHGADAPAVASQRFRMLLKEGDYEGAVTWRYIVQAVDELLRTKPKTGEGAVEKGACRTVASSVSGAPSMHGMVRQGGTGAKQR